LNRIFKTILLFLFILSSHLYSQNEYNYIFVADTFAINIHNEYKLTQISIVPGSESLSISGNVLGKSDYKISYKNLKLSLSDSLEYRINDTLLVVYKTHLLSLLPEYRKRKLIVRFDETSQDTLLFTKPLGKVLSNKSIFGSQIEQSGSIIRGFTVGTNKDFSINSGLRLQLSGQLSDDISIVAALTDENVPIQPEGNTERLEELDKVFIQLNHKNASGTFGDFDLKSNIGEFGKLNRKLQGLKGEYHNGNVSAQVAIAGSRGKFTSNEFTGIDGVQGPYRLYGKNSENNIIVIAGSERVYFNGEEMKRGENNDYTIEYANAEIIFTPNRLITSASRITIDFEYTDQQYNRNFYSASVQTKFFDDRLKLKFSFAKEGDDESNPIDLILTDSEKRLLENAGDNPLAAATDGAVMVTPDSLGNVVALYTRIDTTISGEESFYYLYDPGGANSNYNVTFSYVGERAGDYDRESLNHYKYVGANNGAYLPVRFLPLPVMTQMGNILIESEPFEKVYVNIELAGSSIDKNLFSDKDDDDNFGYARNLFLDIKPREIAFGDLNFGKVGLTYKDRYLDEKFTSLDRINEIEFDRYYNVGSKISSSEQLREFKLYLAPIENVNINGKYGYLKKGDLFESNRYVVEVSAKSEKTYDVNYNIDYVNSTNNQLSTDWFRQNGRASLIFGNLIPGIDFLTENREDSFSSSDSLITGSLKYFEVGPFLQLVRLSGFDVTLKYSFREESFPINGVMEKESAAITKNLRIAYKSSPEINSTFDLTLRDKKYTDIFKAKGFLDNETILIRSKTQLNLLKKFIKGDIYYEATTERSAQLEKVFIRVEQGTGSYRYLGDLNNNGIAEENEFEPTTYDGDFIVTTIPTDRLFPVIDLKANTRWRIEFNKIIKGNNLTSEILKSISTDTFFRLQEISKESDTKKIYLLNLSHFLNDSTTISGSNYFQNDFHIMKNNRELSFRLRYSQRKYLNSYSSGIEKGYSRERGLRIRFQMLKEINTTTEYINKTDFVAAPSTSNRSREVKGNELISDFSYRPSQNIEFGFKLKVGQSEDAYPDDPTIINENSQSLRLTLSFAGKGRLRIEAERNELLTNNPDNYIPFEITLGNVIGKNFIWRTNFDYRIANNLQSTLYYEARIHGGSKALHTMRAELRAYF